MKILTWTLVTCALLSALLACTHAHSGVGAGGDVCTEAAAYMHHAEHCAEDFRLIMYYYLFYDDYISESGFGSGTSSGSGFFVDYFYDEEEGWDFTDWDSHICTSAMNRMDSCMEEVQGCDLSSYATSYRDMFCDGDSVKESFQQYRGSLGSEQLIALSAGVTCIDLNIVFDLFVSATCGFDISEYEAISTYSFESQKSTLEGGYRATFTCIRANLTAESTCDREVDLLEPLAFFMYMYTLVPGLDVTFDEILDGFDTSAAVPNAPERSTVAVFGDPHLYIFGSDTDSGEFITCISAGDTNYLTNDFVEIYGFNTNWDVNDPNSATFMTSVTIAILDGNGETIAEYAAENSQLPTSLTSNTGDAEIEVKDSGHVVINSYTAGVAIAVARYGHTYQLVVRMSDSVFASSSGLLYSGCTGDDLISRGGGTRRRRSVECEGVPATQRDACEYDLLVTGDAELAAGASSAISDMVTDAEELDSTLVEDEKDGAAALTTTLPLPLLAAAYALLG